MKTVILYNSITGHSKRIANAIAHAHNIPVYKISPELNLENFSNIILIGGIYAGKSHPSLIKFVESINVDHIKNVVLITSSAANKTGQNVLCSILEKKLNKTIKEHRLLGNFLFFKAGHPTTVEIANAVSFAKEAVESFTK